MTRLHIREGFNNQVEGQAGYEEQPKNSPKTTQKTTQKRTQKTAQKQPENNLKTARKQPKKEPKKQPKKEPKKQPKKEPKKQPKKEPKKQPKTSEIETRSELVLRLIKDQPKLSRNAISVMLGLTSMEVRTALDYLKAKGKVHHEGASNGGCWVIDGD